MKKRLLLGVFAVMIAAVMGIAIACGDDDKPATYKVTYVCSSELGTVEITDKDGNAKTTFKSGEDVTVTVTPDEGYTVVNFKVNNADAELVNGKHTFKISKDTTVLIEYDIATYTATVVYNPDRGTVTTEDENGNAKATFNHGDTVVVNATASADYAVVGVKVNGTALAPEIGVYQFTIKQNVEVEVAFGIPAITQEILDTSNARLRVSGSYVYSLQGDDPLTYKTTTVYGTDSISIEESLNGTLTISEAYINQGGKLALAKHTIDNQIDPQLSDDDFSEYYNPFALLLPTDFETTDRADVFKIIDPQTARIAATALTGWTEKIGVFEVTVKDGKLVSAYIETVDMVSGGTPYSSVYSLEFTEHGTAELEAGLITPYEHKPEHDLLSAALAEMAQAESYTISYLDHEDGYVDIVYTIYVAGNVIYETCPGEENGYVQLNNKVYPFDYRSNENPKITLLDPVRNITDINQLHAGFVGNYAKELFELTEDGGDYKVFTLRCPEFAGKIFSEFGDGVDKMKYYAYAVSGSITLDENNKLLGATFSCNVFGSYSTVTITYNDVNSTDVPEELDFSDCAQSSKFEDWVGTYVDKYYGTDSTVVINTEDGIIIDGTIVEVVSTSIYNDYFIISYEDVYLYVMKKSARQLIICDDAYLDGEVNYIFFEFILESDDTVIIPADYRGEWYGFGLGVQTFESGEAEDDVAYDATTNTITVKLYTAQGDPAGEYRIIGSDDDVLNTLIFRFGNGEAEYYEFVRDIAANDNFAGEIIPTKYTGRFKLVEEVAEGLTIESTLYIANDIVILDSAYAEDAALEITATTITLYEYDEEGELQPIEIEVLSYDATDGLVGYYSGLTLYFEIKNDVLSIRLADGVYYLDEKYIFDEKEDEEDPGVVIPNAFIGKFTGFDGDTFRDYTLTVTADSVKLAIGNGADAPATEATVISAEYVEGGWSSGWEMTIEVNGVKYIVAEGYTADRITIMTADNSVYVTLDRVKEGGGEGGGDSVEIPDELYGTYMGSGYYITIGADGVNITRTSDSHDFEVVVTDYMFDSLILTLDGEEYSFYQATWEDGEPYYLSSNDNEYTLTKLA
ncbi:MAG: hypothetical protein K2M48_03660 [Clostridiales bacterium]|nr:hypothetical protein [Clostridiales bacterium]